MWFIRWHSRWKKAILTWAYSSAEAETGVCMTANKYAGIRAGLCWTEELAKLARQHNNANIICIPARFVEH